MTPSPRAPTGRLPPACRRLGLSPTKSPAASAATPAFRASTARRPAPRRRSRAGWRCLRRTAGRWRRRRRSKRSRKRRRDSRSAGVTLASRRDNEKVAAVEEAITGARELSHNIIAWESRWPLNTYRARDTSKLSQAMLDLAARADAMTLDDYRRDIRERQRRRPPIKRWRGNSTPASPWRRPARRRSASLPRATRASSFQARCWASRRSRCPCFGTMACRSGFSSSASPTRTPRCFRSQAAC